MTDQRCFFHGDEPVRPEHTRVCGECGHAYTDAELVARDLRVRAEVTAVSVAEALAELVTAEDPTAHQRQVYLALGLAAFDLGRSITVVDVVTCPLCSHDL